MCLDEIDPNYGRFKGRQSDKSAKSYLIRYADDSILIVPPNRDKDQIVKNIQQKLQSKGLSLSQRKYVEYNLHQPRPVKFTFLGFEFIVLNDKTQHGKRSQKPLIRPDPENLKKHKKAIKNIGKGKNISFTTLI